MFIVVSILFPIVAIELAIVIWLLLSILHELEELEDHKKPPHSHPYPHPHPCL